jgi:hypothetical protein
MKLFRVVFPIALALLSIPAASAFCGFYVSKADTALYNEASKVVLVRNGDQTTLTMANDYKGDPREFAVVIPVPTVIRRSQIAIGDAAVIDHLDAWSAPRLVEYHDPDPCARYDYDEGLVLGARSAPRSAANAESAADIRARALGVTIEATYQVGEYEILVLSAEQSDGLTIWLTENGYRLPAGAESVLGSYIRQEMKFFVAKVNLGTQAFSGFRTLRPLRVSYQSPRFMLPIRLGMVNAHGPQELFVFALTSKGRVESTNYRTIPLPSNVNIPEYVEKDFSSFYKATFSNTLLKYDNRAIITEYGWDASWCDPCAADPLKPDELATLGVPSGVQPYVTRLHVRYDNAHFPEDLVFQETGDRSNFQGRYILQRPFKGPFTCDASTYQGQVKARQETEAQTLANLTGWGLEGIRSRMGLVPAEPAGDSFWNWRYWW